MRTRRGVSHAEVAVLFVVAAVFTAAVLESRSGGDGRVAALEEGLEVLRTGVEMYRYEHEGRWPAADTPNATAFENALLQSTVTTGGTARGPYVVGRLPVNPFNGLRTVRVVEGESPPADDTTGWTYDNRTGAVTANSRSETADGRRVARF